MAQTLLGKLLFGKVLNELFEGGNEILAEMALLKLKYPKVFWTVESALLDSYYHREHCKPLKEQYERDKEELVYLREVVINLEEEIVKLKVAAKRKRAKAKK